MIKKRISFSQKIGTLNQGPDRLSILNSFSRQLIAHKRNRLSIYTVFLGWETSPSLSLLYAAWVRQLSFLQNPSVFLI